MSKTTVTNTTAKKSRASFVHGFILWTTLEPVSAKNVTYRRSGMWDE
jgi:hypothetical protein